MNVGIVGTKDFKRQDWVENFITQLPTATQICVTGIDGPSRWAEEAVLINNMPRAKAFPIPKSKDGKKHPPEVYVPLCHDRNDRLVEAVDLMVCFWDGIDANTRDIISRMAQKSKPSFILAPDFTEKDADYMLGLALDMIYPEKALL